MRKRFDQCSQLRKLHDRLVEEVRLLRESLQEEEESFDNPLEMRNILADLQAALHRVNLELQKCPPEE
jgi:hypothetical protein